MIDKENIKILNLNQRNQLYCPVYYRDDQFLSHIQIHLSIIDQFDHMICSCFHLQQPAVDHVK